MKSSLRCNIFPLVFCGILFVVTPSVSASAQTLTQGSVHALGDWHSVQALSAQTRVRITRGRKKTTCFIDSVSDDRLTCSSSSSMGSTQAEYAKEEIKEIKLTNRTRSAVGGAALGAGIGAGVGAAIGAVVNSVDQSSYLHVSSGKATGVGAVIGVLSGAIAGAALGHSKDWFAGPVIYRHP